MKWQPIETAQKDGTWVILYHEYSRLHEWFWDNNAWTDGSLRWCEGHKNLSPKYWIKLDPPNA